MNRESQESPANPANPESARTVSSPENLFESLARKLAELRAAGLFKEERILSSPQGAQVVLSPDSPGVGAGREVLNLCANNYLGLGGHPALVDAAKRALDRLGLRPGLGPLHLRHPGNPPRPGGAPGRLPGKRRTPSSSVPASTPTGACSRRCWARRTPSSATRSTMPASSTASACARPGACATATTTWPIWRSACSEAADARFS